jgi:hypothetical protein
MWNPWFMIEFEKREIDTVEAFLEGQG